MENKEPTRTIYNCLGHSFWTKHKCRSCQRFFSSADYLNQKEIGDVKSTTALNYAVLAGVIVELKHQLCPLTCGFNYQKDIICNQEISKRKNN